MKKCSLSSRFIRIFCHSLSLKFFSHPPLTLDPSSHAGPRSGVVAGRWGLVAHPVGFIGGAGCVPDGTSAFLPREPSLPLHRPLPGAPGQERWAGLRSGGRTSLMRYSVIKKDTFTIIGLFLRGSNTKWWETMNPLDVEFSSSCVQAWGGWPAGRTWAACWRRWRRRRGRWTWRGRCPSWSSFALRSIASPSSSPSCCSSPSSCLGSTQWVCGVLHEKK